MSAPGHPGEKHQQVTPAYEPKEVTMNATFGSSLLEPKCGIHCLLYDDTCTPKACQARYMYIYIYYYMIHVFLFLEYTSYHFILNIILNELIWF